MRNYLLALSNLFMIAIFSSSTFAQGPEPGEAEPYQFTDINDHYIEGVTTWADALEAACVNHNIIYFPEGDYLFTRTFSFTRLPNLSTAGRRSHVGHPNWKYK